MRFKMNVKLMILAVIASFSIAGCNNKTVPEHDHVWDAGEVTKQPTCHTEGIKTFKCTVDGCQQTKTESVAMVPHTWDEGVITTKPTCSETGVMTYTCVNEGCGKTKTLTLSKVDHDYSEEEIIKIPDLLHIGEKELKCSTCDETISEEIKAHADFEEQFDNESFSWKYQSLETFTITDEDLTPTLLTKENGVYKDDNNEVSKGHIKTKGHTLLSYGFNSDQEKISVKANIKFSGADDITRVDAYLLLLNQSNHVKNIIKASSDSKTWEFVNSDENILELQQFDSVCVLISGKNEDVSEGDLSITITAKCIHIWDEGEVTKEATEEEEGILEYTCILCGEKLEHSIPKIIPDVPEVDPLEGYFDFTGKNINRYESGMDVNSWLTDNGHTLHVEVTTPGDAIWKGGTFVNTGITCEAGKAFNISFEVSTLEDNDFEIVFQNKQWDEKKYDTLYSPKGEVSKKINITEENEGSLWLYIQSGNAVNEIVITKLSIEETTPDPIPPIDPESDYFNFNGKILGRFDGVTGNVWVDEGDATKAHVEVTTPGDAIWKGGMFINTGIELEVGKTYTVSMFLERKEETAFEVVLQNKQWDETKYLTIYSELGAVEKDITITNANVGSLWIYIQFGNVVNEITISKLKVVEKE